jgi:hypothetical protein
MVAWRGEIRETDGVERKVMRPLEDSRSKLKNIRSKSFKISVVSRPRADEDAEVRSSGVKSKTVKNIDM